LPAGASPAAATPITTSCRTARSTSRVLTTPEEQKRIDEQYTTYLDNQRHNNIAAAFALKRIEEEEVQQVSLHKEAEKIPLPQHRPKQKPSGNDGRARAKEQSCVERSFSCEWPRLSESWNELKKLFISPPAKAKKS
jgi:hypothetical protein